MWDYIRLAIAAICFILGIFITITALIGNFKYKFVLNRMHAAALIDTLGLFFVVLGLIFLKGFTTADGAFDVTSLKLMFVVLFLWISSPVASHLIAKIIYMTDPNTDKESVEIDVEEGGENNNG